MVHAFGSRELLAHGRVRIRGDVAVVHSGTGRGRDQDGLRSLQGSARRRGKRLCLAGFVSRLPDREHSLRKRAVTSGPQEDQLSARTGGPRLFRRNSCGRRNRRILCGRSIEARGRDRCRTVRRGLVRRLGAVPCRAPWDRRSNSAIHVVGRPNVHGSCPDTGTDRPIRSPGCSQNGFNERGGRHCARRP